MRNKKLNYYLIGISGGTASGKSLFINELKERFPNDEICVISQDEYYKPIGFQKKDDEGIVNFDLPDAIDYEQMFSDLQKLSKGQVIEREEYTFEIKNQKPAIKTYNPSPIIIIEGIFVFYHTKISQLIDLKVYIDSDEEIRFRRRLDRDVKERGITKEIIIHQWQKHVTPAHMNYVLPFRIKSDLIISG